MFAPTIGGLQKTTSHKVVLPFYIYATIAYFVATLLLFFHSDLSLKSYINHPFLAITHLMTLGWGTMMIFGASYQLLPVLIEGKLHSNKIGYLTFGCMATGIPILIYGFYVFNYDWLLPLGAILVNLGVIFYLINVFLSAFNSKKRNIHAWYIIIATLWLFTTTFYGLLLVFNFNFSVFPSDSWHYLTVHAHLGFIGWFLLLVIGVGTRLIPMFMISKYDNKKLLQYILILIHLGLFSFLAIHFFQFPTWTYSFSIIFILASVILFGLYIKKAYKIRIRKKVDKQVKISLFSVVQMLLPFLILALFLLSFIIKENLQITLYGFSILFGWITAIILGMTYKTLPFIMWNKVYEKRVNRGKTLAPKDMFSEKVFILTLITYLIGFFVFIAGILLENRILLKIGAVNLLLSAIFYSFNTGLILFYKPLKT